MSHYDECRMPPVRQEVKKWRGSTEGVTIGKVYSVEEDGFFKDDEGNYRSAGHGAWCLTAETDVVKEDVVNKPSHYQFFDLEAIAVIRASMTKEAFLGYCMGNALKYRLRAGKKDNVTQEIAKAIKYEEIYEELK